jgi:hypothetical protein
VLEASGDQRLRIDRGWVSTKSTVGSVLLISMHVRDDEDGADRLSDGDGDLELEYENPAFPAHMQVISSSSACPAHN